MNEIKQAELTNILNAYQRAEKLKDEEWLLLILEYAKTISRKLYMKNI